jgi:signal peptidase I
MYSDPLVSISSMYCRWKSLQVPVTPCSGEQGFSLNGAALTDLMTAVHEKNVPFRFRARGKSMHPVIRDGDIIVIAPVREYPPVPGMIAAYPHPGTGKLVVHRLRSFRDGRYLGAGDNTISPDGWVSPGDLLGVVTGIERGDRTIAIPYQECYPIMNRLALAYHVQGIPRINSVRRSIIQWSQSPGMKRLSGPVFRAFIRRGLWPVVSLQINNPDSQDIPSRHKNIRIDLFLFRRHAARMEFSQCPTATDDTRWWFSGSGINSLFRGMDIETEVFKQSVKILSKEGIPCIWASIPSDHREIQDFVWRRGFVKEIFPAASSSQPAQDDGKRILIRYKIGKEP